LLAAVALAAGISELKASPLDETAERYRPYMIHDIGQALAGARTLRDRMVARDLDGAKRAWIDSRIGWERSEVFTSGFAPDLDARIDAWPNAVEGFHAIEARLFGANQMDVEEATDALIVHLADLAAKIQDTRLTPQGLLNGIARLAFEVGESKADGGESRFSGTSLDDIRNNVDGIELAYRTIFASALEAGDPALAQTVQGEIEHLKALVRIRDLKNLDADRLRATGEALVLALKNAAPKLALAPPTLEETAK